MREMKLSKAKRLNIIWAVIYLVLTAGVIVSICFLFARQYYKTFWVSGTSMQPTLNKDFNNASSELYHRYEYGISDDSENAKKNIKRFDVILTLYPEDWVSGKQESKIKRVWGLPGETISLKDYVFTTTVDNKETFKIEGQKGTTGYINYSCEIKSFTVVDRNREFNNIVLGENEYFVMGDNWGGSSDSYYYEITNHHKVHLNFTDLVGVVVRIEGTCLVDSSTKQPTDKQAYKEAKYYI